MVEGTRPGISTEAQSLLRVGLQAVLVIPLAVTPLLVSLTFLAIHPEAWSTFKELLTFEQASVAAELAGT